MCQGAERSFWQTSVEEIISGLIQKVLFFAEVSVPRRNAACASRNQTVLTHIDYRNVVCVCIIVKSENMFTLRGRTPHCPFVGAGSPSPYEPTVCANNYGIYYKIQFFQNYAPISHPASVIIGNRSKYRIKFLNFIQFMLHAHLEMV